MGLGVILVLCGWLFVFKQWWQVAKGCSLRECTVYGFPFFAVFGYMLAVQVGQVDFEGHAGWVLCCDFFSIASSIYW